MSAHQERIDIDVAVIGAGAAGLMAAIAAGRAVSARGEEQRIVLLDGARTLGAKILVSGGGRCNVTHDRVDERDFAGSTPPAIRKVLRRFDVAQTIAFFRDLGVALEREETGKLFPTTDSARTVLDALLRAARDAGVEIVHPWRVEGVERIEPAERDERDERDDRDGRDDRDDRRAHFAVQGAPGTLRARTVVLATGGKSLPKSGSDGAGYEIARALGHSITPRILPALVPLTLPPEHFLCALAGVSADVALEVRASSGAKIASFAGALLCTHFGISGPVVLDASRHWIDARLDDPAARLVVSWLPGESAESADRELLARGAISPGRWLRERGLAQRLAEALCRSAAVDPSARISSLPRERRRALARAATELDLPVGGDRGFTHAEVTAGGVPLRELDLATMESRRCPGLYVIGEICDVDGRIGGYNFQWAWASGHVAGSAAAAAIAAAIAPKQLASPGPPVQT